MAANDDIKIDEEENAIDDDAITFEATDLGGGETDDEDVESEDSLTFSNGVIEKIVALGLRDVPGVVGMKGGFVNRVQDVFGMRDARKGVTVEVTPDSAVRVNISVFVAYGAYAPQVFEDVKHAVVDAVTGMTGLEVAGVNLRIEDVLTPEEIEERTPALPEADEYEELPEGAAEPEIDDADDDKAADKDAKSSK